MCCPHIVEPPIFWVTSNYKVDPKMAQKGCDRDSSRKTNPKKAQFERKIGHSGLWLGSRELSLSQSFWAILGSALYSYFESFCDVIFAQK